tara:strand:- start:555 stop:1082 length:528 start_codon:yes stop_codon:yes gene_type:complete
MAITFDTLSEGAVITASGLNTNFTKINDYLNNNIPNSDLANDSHSVCVTINFGDMSVGNAVRGFKVPGTFSTGGLKLREIQVFRGSGLASDDATDNGTVKAQLFTSYVSAYGGSAANAKASVTINDDTTPGIQTSASTSEAFASGASLFVRADVSDNSAAGVTVTLWFIAEHRSA